MNVEPTNTHRRPVKPRGGLSSHSDRSDLALLIAKIILPLLILVMGVGTYIYFIKTKAKPPKAEKVEKVWPVRAQSLQFLTTAPKMTLYGQTTSSRSVELRSLVSGQIIKVSETLKEGGQVKTGDFLVQIDPFQYEINISETESLLLEAEARLTETKASIVKEKASLAFAKKQTQLARDDYERVMELARKGIVTEKAGDDRLVTVQQRAQAESNIETNFAVLTARLKQYEAAVKRTQAQLKKAKRDLADTALKAPFDGYIMDVSAQLGRFMSLNDKVAKLIDKKAIEVRFTLSDQQYGRLIGNDNEMIGRPIEAVWHVGQKPIVYSGKIVRTGAQINASSGGVEIFALLDDPLTPVSLRSGAFVEVSLKDKLYKHVAKVPQTAIYDNQRIYVIKDERLTPRTIQILATNGSDFFIQGDFKEGDQLLTSRLSLAGKGLKVKIVPAPNEADTPVAGKVRQGKAGQGD